MNTIFSFIYNVQNIELMILCILYYSFCFVFKSAFSEIVFKVGDFSDFLRLAFLDNNISLKLIRKNIKIKFFIKFLKRVRKSMANSEIFFVGFIKKCFQNSTRKKIILLEPY